MFIAGAVALTVGSAVVGGLASESASRRAARAQQGASDAAKIQADIAKEQWDRYKSIYAPLEDKYAQEAQDFGSDANFAKAAGDASATVSDQFTKARQRLARTPGLDPSSAGYAASLTGLDLAQAATDATQQNAARTGMQDRAWARKTDALSLGKGLPAQASAGLSSASNNLSNIASSQLGYASQIGAGIGSLGGNIVNMGMQNGWFAKPGLDTTGLGMQSINALEGAAKLPPIKL